MSRIIPIDVDSATGRLKGLFDGIEKGFGRIPNLLKVMGHSPALLEVYLSFMTAMHSRYCRVRTEAVDRAQPGIPCSRREV